MHAGRHLVGLFTSVLCLLAGLWLLLGAWILGLVPQSGAWPGVAVFNVGSGAGITLAGLLALILYARPLTAELAVTQETGDPSGPDGALPLRRRARRRSPLATSQALPAPVASAKARDDAEDVLLPIASALLSDIVRQRGGSLQATDGKEAPR